MILQALKDYYDRKAADPESGIAPLGWERKEIPYLIVLSKQGEFLRLEDTREEGMARSFLVPSLGESKGSGIKSNFPWENAEYVFGFPIKSDKKNKVSERHKAFMERVREYSAYDWAKSILSFLDDPKVEAIASRYKDAWARILKGDYLLFSIEGVPVSDLDSFKTAYHVPQDGEKIVCLVTGKNDVLKEKEPAIKGSGLFKVSKTQQVKSELHIVSFNQDAFRSFGKKQGANATIGQTASFAYTTALNSLLAFGSRQKMQVGDATVVFWAERGCLLETSFSDFFSEPKPDNPDGLCRNVKALFDSPRTGVFRENEERARFYVLGIAPSSSRLVVRFWHVGTVAEMAGRFRVYFDDLLIAHGPEDRDHLSLWRLLVSTAVQGKPENIAPNLAGNVMRSILEGLPFPETLLSAVLTRIKVEHEVSYPRAKLVKGCLNRKWRFNNPQNERKLTVSLDKENVNVGYRLGRLFAVLERIQEAAHSGINATIKDRFYASASSTPTSVFGNLMRLASHHLSKLGKEKPGYAVNLEKLMQEVIAGIARFPAHLSLDDQGQFAIGYYHQRQDFFAKKDAEEQPVNK